MVTLLKKNTPTHLATSGLTPPANLECISLYVYPLSSKYLNNNVGSNKNRNPARENLYLFSVPLKTCL